MKMNFKLDTKKLEQKYSAKNVQRELGTILESISDEDIVKEMKAGYRQSDLKQRTSVLYNSYKVLKENKLGLWHTISVYSEELYARIHEVGGYNGRNRKAYQRPRYYFSKGLELVAKKINRILVEKLKKALE